MRTFIFPTIHQTWNLKIWWSCNIQIRQAWFYIVDSLFSIFVLQQISKNDYKKSLKIPKIEGQDNIMDTRKSKQDKQWLHKQKQQKIEQHKPDNKKSPGENPGRKIITYYIYDIQMFLCKQFIILTIFYQVMITIPSNGVHYKYIYS
jgi:hypothetical protein